MGSVQSRPALSAAIVIPIVLVARYLYILSARGTFATSTLWLTLKSTLGIKFRCTFGGTSQWLAVRDALRENFARGDEVASQLVVYQGTTTVVDEFGRLDDHPNAAGYSADTLQVIFSSSKVVAALCVCMLEDRGLLSYDEPVAQRLWPEFGQQDKGAITVADVLRHEAGLTALVDPDAPDDPERDYKLTTEDLMDPDRLAAQLACRPKKAARCASCSQGAH